MSLRYLPEELWPEILSRVPVKTLLRFRCVSKQWRALIDDPDFARLHLRLFTMNRCETHLIVYQPDGPLRQNKVAVRAARSLKLTSRFHIPQTIIDSHQRRDCWSPLSSIDGLFMLKWNTAGRWPPPGLMLWNPATRKTLTLPPLPEISTPVNDLSAVDFVLGFDPSVKDYKHVRVIQSATSGLHSIAVYSLATNTWKMTRCDQGTVRRLQNVDDKGLCLKGFLFHVAAINGSIFLVKDLVSFDFRSEKLGSIKLPVEDDDFAPYDMWPPGLTMADDGCSLAVVICTFGSGSIWVLEGLGADDVNSCTWSKRYNIPDFNTEASWGSFFYLLKNSELLLRWSDRITSYNLNTDKEKVLIKLKSDVKASPYMESLVAIS